jgi:polysaccharide chain length determinant protein (PEP-CTERM system associated)
MISIHEQINVIIGYLHGLWAYRWSSLVVAWLFAVTGWVFVYTLPDHYSAKATVNIDTRSVMEPLLRGLSVESDTVDEVNVMTRILLSRENLLDVIRETDMDLNINSPQERERLVQQLSASITINNLGNARTRGNIYEISHQSTSAEQSFKVVFNLLNALIEDTLKSGRLDTVKAEQFLDEQIAEYEVRLGESEQRLAEFQKKNAGYMPNEKGGYYAMLRQQQEAIDNTGSDLARAKQAYDELRRQLSGESPLLGSNAYTKATAAKLRGYQEQLNDMLTQFTDEHPDVKSLRARIRDLQTKGDPDANSEMDVLTEEDAASNPVYQDLKAQESRARIEVGTLQVQLAEQRQKLVELKKSADIIPQVEADLVKLNRDYDITKERYLALVERRESARLAQKVEENNSDLIFRVVDAPVVPLFPSGPNRLLLLTMVLVAALGAGLGWSGFRFMLYPTFVDFKQVQKMLELPVLGAISLQITPAKRHQRRVDMATFLVGIVLMMVVYGGVVMFQQQGSTHVRALIASLGNQL